MLETGRCGRHHPFCAAIRNSFNPVLARVTPKLHTRCMLRLAKTATFVPQWSVPVRKRVRRNGNFEVFLSSRFPVAVPSAPGARAGRPLETSDESTRAPLYCLMYAVLLFAACARCVLGTIPRRTARIPRAEILVRLGTSNASRTPNHHVPFTCAVLKVRFLKPAVVFENPGHAQL